MIKNIPVPGIEEYEKGFWEAALESKLVVQHCHDCDQPRFPPRPMCPQCHCLEYTWNQVSGEGEIWSFVNKKWSPGARKQTPIKIKFSQDLIMPEPGFSKFSFFEKIGHL